MKIMRLLVTGFATVVLATTVAAPTFAASRTSSVSTTPEKIQSGIFQNPLDPTPVKQDPEAKAASARLDSLRGKQSAAELEQITNSGTADALVQVSFGKDGKVDAAFKEDSKPELYAIHNRGPGCGPDDACLTNATPNGYYGDGQLNARWDNVTRIASGKYVAGFWYTSSEAYTLKPYSVANNLAHSTYYILTLTS